MLQEGVKVFVDELPVLQGLVEEAGRVYLNNQYFKNEAGEPLAG